MIVCLGTTPALQRTMEFARLDLDAVNRAAVTSQHASGKSINVARVLHTLGESSLATGFLGGDTGAAVRADLDVAGIAHDFVTVPAPTRVCVTVIDRSASTATELVEESKAVEPGDYAALIENLDALMWRASALVLSGSLPPGAPQAFYADCVRLAARAKVPTVLDATGEPLRRALPERPTVVKPNLKELEESVGRPCRTDEELRRAMRELWGDRVKWVVVTRGAAGAVAFDGEAVRRVTPPPVHAVSPIGSGDSFAAGLSASLVRGRSLRDACALAAACAAANVLTPAAGHVRREDVERLLPQVKIESF